MESCCAHEDILKPDLNRNIVFYSTGILSRAIMAILLSPSTAGGGIFSIMQCFLYLPLKANNSVGDASAGLLLTVF